MPSFPVNLFTGTPKRATVGTEAGASVISPTPTTNEKSNQPIITSPPSANNGVEGSGVVDLTVKGQVTEIACDEKAIGASQAMQNVDFRKPRDESYAD